MMENKLAQQFQFLSGTGEMARLTKEKDWSSTSVGPIENWPQSLRTTLSIILNSKFPMFLWWGKELTCFYNDAYRPSLGKSGKHPGILGMPAATAWYEIWEVISPLIHAVLDGGEPTWRENELIPIFRNGNMEDVYWTFSYSAVNDESGTVAGVLVTCTETTDNVQTHQQLEKKEAQLKSVIQQAPVAIAIFRGPNYLVEMANPRALQLWDKVEAAVLNKPILSLMPELQVQGIKELLDQVYTTGTTFSTTEHPVQIIKKGRPETVYINFNYQALFDINGAIDGIITVGTDVTEQVQSTRKIEESEKRLSTAVKALTESEKQFRRLVMQSPIPMTILKGKNHIIEMANNVMFESIWRKKEADIVGKSILDVFPELQNQKYPELLNEVFVKGKSHSETESVAYVQGDDGMRKFYLDYEYAPLFESDDRISGIIITVNDVTEKVNARQRVEESEKRFRNVADSAPVLMRMSGTDKRCHFFNKAWLNFTGEIIVTEKGKGWADGVHPDDVERCLNKYETAFSKHEAFYMEYRLRRHDGAYRWISDSGVPRFTGDGIFEGYIGASTDIHERTLYQQNLAENEERLNIVIEASKLSTWEINLQGTGISYSDSYLEMLGYDTKIKPTHEELLSGVHPDDLNLRNKAFENSTTTGVLYYISRMIGTDGSIRWIENRGKVFYDVANKPEKLIGTSRDITEEKNYQHQLEEREQKFRVLADSMPQFIWTGNADGVINYFNQAVYNYSGLSVAEIEKEGWLQIVHPDDREENISKWVHSIKTGEDYIFEHRFRKHDGSYRWQLSRAIPQKDLAGNIQMWVGTSTDIEEQKTFTHDLERQVQQRTNELQKKNKELQAMNVELQSFAYVSSHDLQEPLRKIQVFANMINEQEKENLSENGKDYFNRMQLAAARMQTLIKDLLAYSRTNITERNFEKIGLNKILDEVKNDLKEDIKQKDAQIEAGNLCEVSIIPFQFRQLLNNLIGNALKFSKPGIPSLITITASTQTADELLVAAISGQELYCHITISDNGIGFDQHYKEKIFEVFHRLHGKAEYKGTGIGLAIVKKIVENHNGFITATGELNKGATFDIYFPL